MERVDHVEQELAEMIDQMDRLVQQEDPVAIEKLFNIDSRVGQLVEY